MTPERFSNLKYGDLVWIAIDHTSYKGVYVFGNDRDSGDDKKEAILIQADENVTMSLRHLERNDGRQAIARFGFKDYNYSYVNAIFYHNIISLRK